MRSVLAVALAVAGAIAGFCVWGQASHVHQHAPLSALEQTYLPIAGAAPVSAAGLQRADGQAFPAQGLAGHWTLLFFGFTSCPDVCPMALQALSAVARNPASGVAAGTTQIVFVSTDPQQDTPERMRAYLESFDRRIVGLRGDLEAVRRLADAAGAGFSAGQADHSTSIFVLDPRGHVAGVLLRSSEPGLIVADLAKLQRVDVSTTRPSR